MEAHEIQAFGAYAVRACRKPIPAGHVRIWEDDGQGGGRFEVVSEAEAERRERERFSEELERLAFWAGRKLEDPESANFDRWDWAALAHVAGRLGRLR